MWSIITSQSPAERAFMRLLSILDRSVAPSVAPFHHPTLEALRLTYAGVVASAHVVARPPHGDLSNLSRGGQGTPCSSRMKHTRQVRPEVADQHGL